MKSFWRKEHDHKRGIVVYHCDEHDYHTSNPRDAEAHQKIHDVGPFFGNNGFRV